MAAVYRAKEPFAFYVGNVPFVVGVGDLVEKGDVRYVNHEHLFELVEEYVTKRSGNKSVEQATASPGERRVLRAKSSGE